MVCIVHQFFFSCIHVGGWCAIMCPGGVVYSLKFLIRAESPQDYADLLLIYVFMILREVWLHIQMWLGPQTLFPFSLLREDCLQMRKNNYFLNNAAPATNIFLLRSIVHHRNQRTNNEFIKRDRKTFVTDTEFNDYCQAVLCTGKSLAISCFYILVVTYCLISWFCSLKCTYHKW